MNARTPHPQGLTRLIFETLVSLTPEVVSSGEHWSPEILDRVDATCGGNWLPWARDVRT